MVGGMVVAVLGKYKFGIRCLFGGCWGETVILDTVNDWNYQ